MSMLKPLVGRPLTFWHVAGDIIWRGTGRPLPINAQNVEPLLDLLQSEHDAAMRSGDRLPARRARRLFLELTDAVRARGLWRRAVTGERSAA